MSIDNYKKLAAELAVSKIESEMIVGLGTGSTAMFALKKIAELIKSGELKNILGIPSSIQTEKAAIELNIPLTTLDQNPEIDLTIDGADEVAFSFADNHPEQSEGSENNSSNQNDKNVSAIYLIKGGGAALLREKVLAQASRNEIIIVDESKYSKVLGAKWAVPVEVLPFAVNTEKLFLQSINAKVELRVNTGGEKIITDEGNFILDADFGEIKNPEELAAKLNNRAGIVEHGLFIGLADEIIIAGVDGIKEIKCRN